MGWPMLVGSRATATTVLSDRMQALLQAHQNVGLLTPIVPGPQNTTAQFTSALGWSLPGLAIVFNLVLSFCFKDVTFFSYHLLLLTLSPKIKIHLSLCTAFIYFV
jgi:hypothetical protein